MIYIVKCFRGIIIYYVFFVKSSLSFQALAQDQLRSLLELTTNGAQLPVSVATCDGDSQQCERANVQFPRLGAPHIILTNPDMLHCTLLPDVSSQTGIYALYARVLNLKDVYCQSAASGVEARI